MRTSQKQRRRPRTRFAGLFVAVVLLTAVRAVSATTFMSVEPIPNRDIVGQENLTLLRSIGYPNLERWSNLFLSRCLVVQKYCEPLQLLLLF